MIKEDLNNCSYDDFLKEYVISPICDFTISFSYKKRIYQFDFVGVPKNKNGTTAYEFVSYEKGWDSKCTRIRFKSLKEAIENVRIDNLSFKEIFEKEDSEIIDIS